MLPLPLMERVLRAANELIPFAGAEITVEANPGTVLGRDYLRQLRSLGVNRLSMGVQSLHDPTLRVLGRIHTAAEARVSYEDARRAGFENINLDFIFGLPGQTVEQWDATLREIGAWQTDHFSLYSLILEEKTPLYAQVMGGRLSVPDEDATADMYERAIDLLGAAGYEHYEISNWAKNQNQEPRTENREPEQRIKNKEQNQPDGAIYNTQYVTDFSILNSQFLPTLATTTWPTGSTPIIWLAAPARTATSSRTATLMCWGSTTISAACSPADRRSPRRLC